MSYYQILFAGGGVFTTFTLLILINGIHNIRRDKGFWQRSLSIFLTLFAFIFFGGLGLTTIGSALKQVEHQTPPSLTVKPPKHWYRCQ